MKLTQTPHTVPGADANDHASNSGGGEPESSWNKISLYSLQDSTPAKQVSLYTTVAPAPAGVSLNCRR